MTLDLETYRHTLTRSPLSSNTRRAYESRVAGYLAWLATADVDGDPLIDPNARDWAVRDYRSYLKTQHTSPSTINATMSALDHFYISIGLGPAQARRESLPQAAPRALDPQDQKRFLRTLETAKSRDRAIGQLGFYAGLRISEIVALNISDVSLSTRLGTVKIWHGKGDTARTVPLHPELRRGIGAWLDERKAADADALFVSRSGERLSVRSAGAIVAKIGQLAGIDDLTPHVLRHTFATNLTRGGTDLVIVAELCGHRRLDTTRRYSLPTAADRQRAVEMLPVEG